MIKRVWRSPWWPAILAAVPVLITLWAASPPGGYFGMAFVAIVCWLVVGIAWLVAVIRAVVALPQPRRGHVGRLWPFLVVPALVLTTWAVVRTGAVERAAFEVHRTGLEALVADVAAAPDHRVTHRRVGLHAIRMAAVDPGGCTLLTVGDAGFLDATGYAYCPDRAPVDVVNGEGLTYEPLDGPWYEFTFRW